MDTAFLLKVSVVQVHDRDGAAQYYNVEKLLPDYSNFKKWNTNFGAVNIDEQLIQAFSHWTYDITGTYSKSLVYLGLPPCFSSWLSGCGGPAACRLQGVERSEEFGLTDPCINCKEPRFGSTNMGDVGIGEFFRTHICNPICKEMRLNEITIFKKVKKAGIRKIIFGIS